MGKLIPEEILIGPYKITVEYEKNMYISRRNVGEYQPANHKIVIDEEACEVERLELFIHETLEAIASVYNLSDGNHHHLSVFAVGLAQALQPIWKEKEKAND